MKKKYLRKFSIEEQLAAVALYRKKHGDQTFNGITLAALTEKYGERVSWIRGSGFVQLAPVLVTKIPVPPWAKALKPWRRRIYDRHTVVRPISEDEFRIVETYHHLAERIANETAGLIDREIPTLPAGSYPRYRVQYLLELTIEKLQAKV